MAYQKAKLNYQKQRLAASTTGVHMNRFPA